jgi:serine/threonine protein kinase
LILKLRFCEKKAVIHGDLTPGNVLLDERGEIKIGNFGSSKNGETLISMSRARGGTLYYQLISTLMQGMWHPSWP